MGPTLISCIKSSFRLYLPNQLKNFNQIVHRHSVSDIDVLKVVGVRSRSCGNDIDFLYTKLVQANSPELVSS